MCNKFHRLPTPDVMLLPVNYAVLDIVKNIAAQDEPPSVPQKPLCGVCNTSPATVICIHCLPNTFFKFCDKCDLDEHMRKFDPVRRHKRFPIGSSLVPGTSTTCSRHAHSAATLYSELLAEFACHLCQQEEDWQARAVHFEDTLKVTEKLKERVKMLTKYSSEMIWKLGESKQNLEAISNDLEPSSLAVKTQVTETFSKCVELLQERQKTLLANVDMEVSWFCEFSDSRMPIFQLKYYGHRTPSPLTHNLEGNPLPIDHKRVMCMHVYMQVDCMHYGM